MLHTSLSIIEKFRYLIEFVINQKFNSDNFDESCLRLRALPYVISNTL